MQGLYKYKPIQFFIITFLWTWAAGLIVAYLSYHKGVELFQLAFLLLGLCGPFVTAMIMIYGSHNKALIEDFWDRLSFYKVRPNFLPVLFLLLPVVLLLATAISLAFGQPIDQFVLASDYRVIKGQNLVGLFILVLAPLIEELGWRGYGVDSLRSRFNLFKTTLLFGVLWALWHVPLFFVNGYYQNELWKTSLLFVANFFISIFPGALLINWIYYKNNRSIMAAFLMHLMFNLSAVVLQTEQFTKCIITVLLLMISGVIIVADKDFFFKKGNVL
jgi:uncharacterized protein